MEPNTYPSYQKARQISLTVPWKIVPCFSGDNCWCRMIQPVEPIYYNETDYIDIVGSGAISKEVAEHIVLIHNATLPTPNKIEYY